MYVGRRGVWGALTVFCVGSGGPLLDYGRQSAVLEGLAVLWPGAAGAGAREGGRENVAGSEVV